MLTLTGVVVTYQAVDTWYIGRCDTVCGGGIRSFMSYGLILVHLSLHLILEVGRG